MVVALAGLVSLVPLGVWLATGSRVQAWRALRGYGAMLLVLVGLAAVGALAGLVGAFMS